MGRYVLNNRLAVRWLTTIPANPAAPTQTEISAGVNLIGSSQAEALTEVQGFAVEPSTLPTEDFASLEVGNVGGPQRYPDSRLSFFKDSIIEVIYSALADGEDGWVLMMFDGQGATEECELFPASVLTNSRRPVKGEAHIFDVNFAIGVPIPGVQAA